MIAHLVPRLICSFRTGILRDFAVVFSGSVAAQAVGLVAAPILTRIYSPAEFGQFGAFAGSLMIVASAATLEYGQVVVLARDEDSAASALGASILSTVLITAVFAVPVLIFPEFERLLLGGTSAPALVYLLIAGVFASGISQGLQGWCARRQSFKIIAAAQIVRSVTVTSLQMGLGCLGLRSPGLASATVGAESAVIAYFGQANLGQDRHIWFRSWTWQKLRAVAWEYREFPYFAAPQKLLAAASSNLPVVILAHLAGPSAAGAFALAVRLLQTPADFFAGSIRQVLFQKIAAIHNKGESIFAIFRKTTLASAFISVLAVVAVWLVGPVVVDVVLGRQWHQSGVFAVFLVAAIAGNVCAFPAVLSARVLRFQKRVLGYDLLVTALKIVALYVGVSMLGEIWGIALYAGISSVGSLALVGAVWLCLRGRCVPAPKHRC